MTNEDILEIQKGNKWVTELVNKVQDNPLLVGKYKKFNRRVSQIRGNNNLTNNAGARFLHSVIRFALGIGYINFLIIKSCFRKPKISAQFSIWDSDISSFVNNETFKKFISTNQVVHSIEDGIIFIRSKVDVTTDSQYYFIQNPIYNTLLFLKIPLVEIIFLNLNFIKNFFFFIKSYKEFINSYEIFKDLLTEPIIKLYKSTGMIKLFRTNAEVSSQEFWCEDIDFNTVWYSTNSRTMYYKNIPFDKIVEHPFFHLSHFGTSWSWNQSHANWINDFYKHNTKIVGPIIFAPIIQKQKIIKDKKRLLIFDVTPFEREYLRTQVLHHGVIYIDEEMSINFIKNILSAMANFNWEIVLKPKRAYNKSHSKKYINYINEQIKINTNFRVTEPTLDMIDEITQSDLIISIPLTSPFELAKFLKIPTYYMDPTGTIDFEKMAYTSNDYITDTKALIEVVGKLN